MFPWCNFHCKLLVPFKKEMLSKTRYEMMIYCDRYRDIDTDEYKNMFRYTMHFPMPGFSGILKNEFVVLLLWNVNGTSSSLWAHRIRLSVWFASLKIFVDGVSRPLKIRSGTISFWFVLLFVHPFCCCFPSPLDLVFFCVFFSVTSRAFFFSLLLFSVTPRSSFSFSFFVFFCCHL